MGGICPGFQQDEDPGTASGCSTCTWVCTQVVGAERMDRAPGGRGLPEEGGPPPPALACPGPPIRPSVPTPARP